MFGYVRVQLLELRVREYRYYRGVYCGLCRAQGRCTGQCSRMTLSYDYVFLSLLRMALQNGNPTKDAGSACLQSMSYIRTSPFTVFTAKYAALHPGTSLSLEALWSCSLMIFVTTPSCPTRKTPPASSFRLRIPLGGGQGTPFGSVRTYGPCRARTTIPLLQ